MNLSHLKKMSEDDDFFHVQDMRAGDTFRVAKKGLSPELHGQIAQHFSDGGVALKDAGKAAAREGLSALEQSPIGLAAQGASGLYDALKDPELRSNLAATGKDVLSDINPFSASRSQPPAPASVDPGPQPGVNMEPVGGFTPAPPGTPAPPAAPPPPQQPAPGTGGGGPPTSGAGVPSYDKTIMTATGQESRALRDEAALAKQQADEEVSMRQASEARKAAIHQEWNQRWAAVQGNADKLQKDIGNGTIDANQWWHSRNVAQKMSGVIGLILGGIGQSFGGGPNAAKEIIDKSISQDIEAQKANLGKKQTQLGHYIQQGHDIHQAESLATADEESALAAQLSSAKAKFAGLRAGPEADKSIAELNLSSMDRRKQAMAQGLQMALTKSQLEEHAESMKERKVQRAAVEDYLKGGAINPYVPKEIRELAVDLPGGKRAMASSPKEAEEIRASQEEMGGLKKNLQGMRALVEAHPHGISKVLSREDEARAEELYNSTLTKLNNLEGLKRFTETEKEIYAHRINDIRNLKFSSAGDIAKLDALAEEIDNKVSSQNKHLLGKGAGSAAPAGLVKY